MKLSNKFFERNSVEVARDLIGKYLVRMMSDGSTAKFMITETEAYDGEPDLACHACKGRNKRTEVLYWKAGTLYVYLVYGMHWMLNIVCDKKDYPSAVLIRGLEGVSGPGRVTKFLDINKEFHGTNSFNNEWLWFENNKMPGKIKIRSTPRIGVNYSGPVWSNKKYRFVLDK